MMNSINSLSDLRAFGVNVLTGESCADAYQENKVDLDHWRKYSIPNRTARHQHVNDGENLLKKNLKPGKKE